MINLIKRFLQWMHENDTELRIFEADLRMRAERAERQAKQIAFERQEVAIPVEWEGWQRHDDATASESK